MDERLTPMLAPEDPRQPLGRDLEPLEIRSAPERVKGPEMHYRRLIFLVVLALCLVALLSACGGGGGGGY
jgi:hypothetical protein